MYIQRKKSGESDLQDGKIEVYRPTKFEMSGNTTMDRRRFEWTCYYADLLINKAKMQHGGTEGGRFRLHSRILKENVGKNYKSYLEAAESFGVVNRVGRYQRKKHSYGYELGQGFTDDFTLEPITNGLVRRRLFKIREKQEEAQRLIVENFDRERIKRWLLTNLYKIKYASGEIPAGETELATTLRRIQATEMIENRWRARFDRFGRLHTNLTNLPRAMRGKLTLNGTNLVAVDIGASQPTFLCVLADEVRSGRITGTENRRRGNAGKETPLSCTFFTDGSLVERLSKTAQCESWDRFRADIESGSLYENIRDAISRAESGKEITLSEAKQQTLMGMYIQANRNTPGVKALRQLYRGPHRFLVELKRTAVSDLSPSNDWIEWDEQAHCKASHCLQWIESTFIFDTIIARMIDERPEMFAATIHDAIVVEPENAAYVKGLMDEAFDKKGIAGRLKVEDLRI